MRILIVAAHFPPETNIASFRPYYFAKYWSEAGADVTVLTVEQKSGDTQLDLDLLGIRIVRVPNVVQERLRKLVMGGKKAEGALFELSKSKSLVARLKSNLINFSRRYGIFCAQRWPDFFDLWAINAYQVIKDESFDVVLTTAPPFAIHRIGQTYKKRHPKTTWVADWRDLWIHHPIFPGHPWCRWLEKKMEKAVVTNADLNSYATKGMAAINAKGYGDAGHPVVAYNGYATPINFQPAGKPYRGDELRIIYTGTIYPKLRDPYFVFSAFRAALDKAAIPFRDLKFIFAGSCESAKKLAQQFNIEKHVEILGRISHSETIELQKSADALLYIDCIVDTHTGVIGGKLFEYMATLQPVLCVNSPAGGEAASIISDSGCGIVFRDDQVEQLRDFFLSLLSGQDFEARPNIDYIGKFTRKTSALNLLAHIKSRT